MTATPKPNQKPTQRAAATIINGPWPSYSGFRGLPERERWVLYGSAKAYRAALEDQGLMMSESYDEFIKRVSAELEI